jgi:hypothetical protein
MVGTGMLPSGRATPSAKHNLGLSGLSHAACMLAVYASRLGCPSPRKTRYRPAGPALAGRDSHPLGSDADFQGDIGFLLPISPGFAWRNARARARARSNASTSKGYFNCTQELGIERTSQGLLKKPRPAGIKAGHGHGHGNGHGNRFVISAEHI